VGDGEEAILTVALTLFDDGCVLGVTINHGCSDGGSFAAFMNDWSDCHAGKQIEPVLMGFPKQALRVPSEQEVAHFTSKETSFVKDLLEEWNDPNSTTRADKAAHGVAPARRQRLHFSEEALQRLKSEAEEGADTWVSTNEALLTHMYTLLLDAAGVLDREKCAIDCAVDLRGKVGDIIPQRVLGRAVVYTNANAGEELLVDMSDRTKAGERVHYAMREQLNPSKLLCRREGFENYLFAHNIHLRGPAPESTHKLSWNFQGKTPFYAIDFGAGRAVRGVPWNAGECVKVAPCAQGGVDVFISDTAKFRTWAEHDFVGQVVAAHQSE